MEAGLAYQFAQRSHNSCIIFAQIMHIIYTTVVHLLHMFVHYLHITCTYLYNTCTLPYVMSMTKTIVLVHTCTFIVHVLYIYCTYLYICCTFVAQSLHVDCTLVIHFAYSLHISCAYIAHQTQGAWKCKTGVIHFCNMACILCYSRVCIVCRRKAFSTA